MNLIHHLGLYNRQILLCLCNFNSIYIGMLKAWCNQQEYRKRMIWIIRVGRTAKEGSSIDPRTDGVVEMLAPIRWNSWTRPVFVWLCREFYLLSSLFLRSSNVTAAGWFFSLSYENQFQRVLDHFRSFLPYKPIFDCPISTRDNFLDQSEFGKA